MRTLLLALLLLLAPAVLTAQNDPIAAGDAAWARRAEGRQGPRAAAGPVSEAVNAYERAVKEQPDRLETVVQQVDPDGSLRGMLRFRWHD